MECPLLDGSLTEDVRSVLLNFSFGYITENPVDPNDYGLRFFEKSKAYQDHKTADQEKYHYSPEDDESDKECLWSTTNNRDRRDAVCFQRDAVKVNRVLFPMSKTQKLRMKLFFHKLFPFKNMNEHLLNQIIDGMVRVEVTGGDVVMRQGDEAQNVFIIESGAYEEWVTSNGVSSLLFRYESWSCFGLASLIYPHVAQATVIAKKDGALWALNCAEYRSLVTQHEKTMLEIKRNCLEKFPLISKLSNLEKEKLMDGMEYLCFKKDCSVISCSIHTNGLYYVRTGTVLIRYKNNISGIEEMSRVASPGEHFGDLSMFCSRLNGTRAVALEPCELVFLSAGSFERLLGPLNRMVFPENIGPPLLRYGRWDDALKISLYERLRNLIQEYKKQDSTDLLNLGLSYYRKVAQMKNSSDFSVDVQTLQTKCRESGDSSYQMVMTPQLDMSDENLTYAIDEVHPNGSKVVDLKNILRTITIFAALSEMKLSEVVNAMRLITVYAGHYVVKSGKLGQYFYVVEEGEFRTVVNGEGVTHEILNCPRYFGELGLILDVPRFADVTAVTKGCLWVLSREKFRRIISKFPIKRKGVNFKLVKQIRRLSSLPDYDVKALSLSLDNVIYKDRDVIHSFEEDSVGLYFVKKGIVRIYSKNSNQNHLVARNGQNFGYLVFSMRKSDDIKAQSVGMSKIASLKIGAFENLLEHCRKVLYRNKCLQSKY